jgi:hypothetical protein
MPIALYAAAIITIMMLPSLVQQGKQAYCHAYFSLRLQPLQDQLEKGIIIIIIPSSHSINAIGPAPHRSGNNREHCSVMLVITAHIPSLRKAVQPATVSAYLVLGSSACCRPTNGFCRI